MNKDLYYMNIAKSVAEGSKDPSRKVGAIIVNDGTLIGTGYNGMASLLPYDNIPEYWERPIKYEYVVHAEENAIINVAKSNGNTKDSTLYVTFHPCHKCASRIVNAGIKRVVTYTPCVSNDKDWIDSIRMAKEIFYLCNVKLDYV